MFFITQIKSAMDTGNHASEVVQILDEQRSSMSIPPVSLQTPAQEETATNASAAPSPSASDPHGAVHV